MATATALQELVSCTTSGYLDRRLKRYGTPASSSEQLIITPDSELQRTIRELGGPTPPAHTWALMGEQREWYCERLREISSGKEHLSIALLFPSVTHYTQQMDLIHESVRDAELSLFIVEQSSLTLSAIEVLVRSQGASAVPKAAYGPSKKPVYSGSIGRTDTYLLQVESESPDEALDLFSMDIVSAYHPTRLFNGNSDNYLAAVHRVLKIDGHFLVAQPPDALRVPFATEGEYKGILTTDDRFIMVNSAQSWDIYGLDHNQRRAIYEGKQVIVPNTHVLLDLQNALVRSMYKAE